jgi:hypothetical protein
MTVVRTVLLDTVRRGVHRYHRVEMHAGDGGFQVVAAFGSIDDHAGERFDEKASAVKYAGDSRERADAVFGECVERQLSAGYFPRG